MDPTRVIDPGTPYVELHMHTCYSLLEGASKPAELIGRAAELGYRALAVTDRNNLYGAMVFARRCLEHGIRPIIGAELTVAGDPDDPDDPGDAGDADDPGDPGDPGDPASAHHDLTLLAASRQGYANLCRLVSVANGWGMAEQADRERRRLDPCLPLATLRQHTDGLVCLTGGRRGEVATLVTADDHQRAAAAMRRWVEWFGVDNVWVELHDNLVHGDRSRNRALVALARQVGVGIVATGDVHYHERDRARLHDALCAIRHRTTLDECHKHRRPNSEFFLRAPQAQARRFSEWPEAVTNTVSIAERCTFELTADLGYRLPAPPVPPGHDPDSWLAHLCHAEIDRRYPSHERAVARARLDEELGLIRGHGLAGFFLVYHDVLAIATEVAAEVRGSAPRGRVNLPPGRGRGSSVSSIVCYLIGLSHVDPIKSKLSIGRFLNDSMSSLPDIDLDFPRDIRDRLFQRVYQRWGIDRAALVAIFPSYRIRSAVRDLGKALGLPAPEIDRLAKLSEGYASAGHVEEEMARIPQFAPLVDAPGWRELIELAGQLAGFPRHVSQHVGGMIIASDPLIDCVPIQPAAWPGRYVCHWDKDDIDDARMVKIDFLALGMLSLVEECLDLCAEHRGDLVDLSRIDFDDDRVYDRIGQGDTIGVFQIESRAQAGILPRTKPRSIDDLTAQVAIIRPGPIVGGAVHAYVSQRGTKPDLHPTVADILEETFGVVLYQEQVVDVAVAMGGYTAGEAETFRRALGRKDWDREGNERATYRERFMAGATAKGVPLETATEMFERLAGFAHFGFPKSHAAAFAVLAYQSAWLKEYYPTEFFCALFNNWPMGFYPPHVFTNDARRHGVGVHPPAINVSKVVCTVEGDAVRLGMRSVRGMGKAAATAIVDERDRAGPYRSLWDFVQRTGLAGEPVENAIRVGVFDEFGLRRRELLWQLWLFGLGPGAPVVPAAAAATAITAVRPRQLRLDLFSDRRDRDPVDLPEVTNYEAMAAEYEVLGLSPRAHPMQFMREGLGHRCLSTHQLRRMARRSPVDIAGLVVCRQRPGTAEGLVFLLLEDEYGLVNVVLSARLYDEHRVEVRGSQFLRISGVLDGHAGDVATVRARTIEAIEVPTLSPPDGKSWG